MPTFNLAYPDNVPVGPEDDTLNGEPGTIAKDAGIDLSDAELQAVMTTLVEEAVRFTDGELSPERARLADYFYGKLPSPDAEPGRSEVVIRAFADAVNRIMPSLLRVFFGGERYVEFRPRQKAKVEIARQQTEYIDDIVIKEDNGGLIEYHAWFWDALVKRQGVVKWWPQELVKTDVLVGTAYDKPMLEALAAEEGVEIMRTVPSKLAPQMFDVTYRRTTHR